MNEKKTEIAVGGQAVIAVSYTHLTLPTIYAVYISVVAVSLKKKTLHYELGETAICSHVISTTKC